MARLFSRSVVWIGTPTVLAVAAMLISIDQFRFAEALLSIAGIWLIGWITFLPHNRFPVEDRVEILLWSGIFGIFIAVGGMFYGIEGYRNHRILAENHGWLSPAGDVTPFDDWSFKGDRSVLLLGSVPIVTHLFPKPILDIDGHPVLSVSKRNGALAVSATIASENGTVISVLENNEFTINPNNILQKENPDFSTMKVVDQHNNVVLHVRDNNDKVMTLLATIRYHGQTIEIGEDGIFVNGKPALSNIPIFSDVEPAILSIKSR
jgi:hypothetical protein